MRVIRISNLREEQFYPLIQNFRLKMSSSFQCPDVRLPDKSTFLKGTKTNNMKRKVEEDDSGFIHRPVKVAKGVSTFKEQRKIISSIKEFSSQSLTGLSKKGYKEDKLTMLGAAPVKQQKMPFQMRVGIKAGREKRKKKLVDQAKESGTVLATANGKASRKGGKSFSGANKRR